MKTNCWGCSRDRQYTAGNLTPGNALVHCRELTVAAPFPPAVKPSSDKAAAPATRPQDGSEVPGERWRCESERLSLQSHRMSERRLSPRPDSSSHSRGSSCGRAGNDPPHVGLLTSPLRHLCTTSHPVSHGDGWVMSRGSEGGHCRSPGASGH